MIAAVDVGVSVDGVVLLPATSIALRAGACVAVRGPNGAGKTTLLRVLAGRLRPRTGSVLLRGRALDERDATTRRHVAALIEPPTLYPDLTIRDHLAFIAAAWGMDSASNSVDELVDAPAWAGFGESALEYFGLTPLAARFPHELSSGQRQLVSLAVTVARPTSLLLLDEPEQRLDPDRRALVADAILAARAGGAAVAFASHDAALVARVADSETVVGGAAAT